MLRWPSQQQQKTAVATFWATIGNLWATVYFNIWSHWPTLKRWMSSVFIFDKMVLLSVYAHSTKGNECIKSILFWLIPSMGSNTASRSLKPYKWQFGLIASLHTSRLVLGGIQTLMRQIWMWPQKKITLKLPNLFWLWILHWKTVRRHFQVVLNFPITQGELKLRLVLK